MVGNPLGTVIRDLLSNMVGNPLDTVIRDLLSNMVGNSLGTVIRDLLSNMVGNPLGAVIRDLLGNMVGNPLGTVIRDSLSNMVGNLQRIVSLVPNMEGDPHQPFDRDHFQRKSLQVLWEPFKRLVFHNFLSDDLNEGF